MGAQATGSSPNHSVWAKAITDADGRYTLKQLGTGTVNIALKLTGQLARNWTARAHEKVIIPKAGQGTGFDFMLTRGSLIEGRVSYADNGKAAARVPVGVYGPAHPRSGAWVQSANTNDDGRYQLRVPPGEQYVYIMLDTESQSGRTTYLTDRETKAIDFEVERQPKGR